MGNGWGPGTGRRLEMGWRDQKDAGGSESTQHILNPHSRVWVHTREGRGLQSAVWEPRGVCVPRLPPAHGDVLTCLYISGVEAIS